MAYRGKENSKSKSTKALVKLWNISTNGCVHSLIKDVYQVATIKKILLCSMFYFVELLIKSERKVGTLLVAQWLRIHLPMQGTRVWALVREDPTCHGATKPVRHYWACALEPMSHNYWARMPYLLKPVCLEPVLRNKRSHHNEEPTHRNEE